MLQIRAVKPRQSAVVSRLPTRRTRFVGVIGMAAIGLIGMAWHRRLRKILAA
jgi:hypothetical protein